MAIVVAAVAILATTVFVVSLPPPLLVSPGQTRGVLRTNLTAFPSSSEPELFVNATTYANQTDGRVSTLTLRIRAWAYYSGVNSPFVSQFWAELTVEGAFASNVHPATLTLAANETGPSFEGQVMGPYVATNISTDGYYGFTFSDSRAGSGSMPLLNQSGPGATHRFLYDGELVAMISLAPSRVVTFRATVTGWLLPSITVGILVDLVDVPA